MKNNKECTICHKKNKTVKERTVKEEGVLSYYDIKVVWCDKCVSRHNYYLMASWG